MAYRGGGSGEAVAALVALVVLVCVFPWLLLVPVIWGLWTWASRPAPVKLPPPPPPPPQRELTEEEKECRTDMADGLRASRAFLEMSLAGDKEGGKKILDAERERLAERQRERDARKTK